MSDTGPLMTARQVMEALELPSSTFYDHEKAGAFRHLLSPRPIGIRKYSRAKVERFLYGESTVDFARRTA